MVEFNTVSETVVVNLPCQFDIETNSTLTLIGLDNVRIGLRSGEDSNTNRVNLFTIFTRLGADVTETLLLLGLFASRATSLLARTALVVLLAVLLAAMTVLLLTLLLLTTTLTELLFGLFLLITLLTILLHASLGLFVGTLVVITLIARFTV